MSKRALIIVDYQNDLAHPKGIAYIRGGELIKNHIEFLKTEFHATDDYVIGVEIALTPELAQELQLKWNRPKMGFVKHTWGQEYAINPNDFDLMISKSEQLLEHKTSAFASLRDGVSVLDEFLKRHNVSKLTIVGIATDVGVSSTASDAFRLGYEVTIDLDGCLGRGNQIRLV